MTNKPRKPRKPGALTFSRKPRPYLDYWAVELDGDGVWINGLLLSWQLARRLHAWLGRALAWHDANVKQRKGK